MRILMISKACVVGIYQRKLELMAQHADVQLTLVVPPSWRDPSGELRLERAYVQGYEMRVEPIRFNGNYHLHYFPTLPKLLREIQPDIVHIDEEPYNFASWHALWHTRRIMPMAKTLFFSWQNITRRYPLPFSAGESWVLKHIDGAIMGTESAAQVWQEKGYRGPCAVIPQFGVDPEVFHPIDRPPNPEPVIGFVGRLRREKGVDLLMLALAKLQKRWRLHIIGQGPERDSLERLARDLDIRERVWFAGHVPSTQMAELYPQLDALVIPSRTLPNWKEQFGRVIVEAMACGVPVIGSDSAAIPDVIGDSGLIFPEDDVDLLATALDAVLTRPEVHATLAERGRQRVLSSFTHARVAALTIDVYRSLLE
ncbi:MAG: glycosyltransferase family 4 protein [Anaerolineae bacterium]|nr:glycosyltransferase family 4 protein [Anaerolineae bacterium]